MIPPRNVFSERKPVHNWQSFGQHNSYYYQPQPATDSLYYQPKLAKYNQCQQYCKYRRTHQDFSKNDYNREKNGKQGNIHSGIPTLEKITHYSIGK